MSKQIKMTISFVLLLMSAVCIFRTCESMKSAREKAAGYVHPYLQIDVTDCEYVGRQAPIGTEGRVLTAKTYFGFYKLTFHVENLGCEYYSGNPIRIPAPDKQDENVRRTEFKGKDEKIEIFRQEGAVIPGKTGADFVCYIEVREGTDTIYASYEAEWFEMKDLEIKLHE